jgi:predicted negative regulator of RcsB-dependent stress response
MNEQSAFHKNSIDDAAAPVKTGGLLEEMNLPPQVVSFIRNNIKQLQIAGICIAVAVIGWVFINSYLEKQSDKAAYALYTAMQEADDESRFQALEAVKNTYSGSAALWSLVEMAHLDFANARYDAGLQKYRTALNEISSDSAMKPLLILSIARTLEQQGDLDGAANQYQAVADMGGFDLQVYPALGRIHAALNNNDKAKKAYEQYLLAAKAGGANPSETAFIEGKIAAFQVSAE